MTRIMHVPMGVQVLPSDGVTSASLWDTDDPAGLQEWLNENLGGDCTTELHEVSGAGDVQEKPLSLHKS